MQTCFECGALADHEHHVIPRSKGGTKTVPLCLACHSRVHGHDLCGRKLTKDALAAKKAQGERVGQIPYGYRLAADGVHLDAEPAERAVVAEARRLAAAGLSFRAVAAELFRLGHLSRTGKPFAHPQVKNMLMATQEAA